MIVGGGMRIGEAVEDPRLAAGLQRLAAGARRTCSVCTGAFLLAGAGLLDGRSATTHWAFCGALARRHPQVQVEPDRIFVRDGNVMTSAGSTAGMDLTLALIEADHGRRSPAPSRAGRSCSSSGRAASLSSPSASRSQARSPPRSGSSSTSSSTSPLPTIVSQSSQSVPRSRSGICVASSPTRRARLPLGRRADQGRGRTRATRARHDPDRDRRGRLRLRQP